MKNAKRKFKRIVAYVLTLALIFTCIGSALATVSAEDALIVTNGNGNATDVGIWYTTYNYDAFWAARFANEEADPVGYYSLLPDGTYGIPESSNTDVIDFHIEKMAEAGIDFIMFDLTNGGLTSDVALGWSDSNAYAGNRWIVEYAKLAAERLSVWNESHSWKIRYAVAVGAYAEILGDLSIGEVAEVQAKAVYEQFVQNEVYGDDYYNFDGKPLLILHDWGEDVVDGNNGWNQYEGDRTYGDMFTVRRGQQGEAGSYGWNIAGNNGVTIHHDEVELVSPGHANEDGMTISRYNEATGNLTYDDCWNTVLNDTENEGTPRVVMIASFNDYMENTAVFVTDTENAVLENYEEKWYVNGVDGETDNYLYWDKTVDYLAELRQKNVDAGYASVEPSLAYDNYALGKTVTASSQLGSFAASNATDGNATTTGAGTTSSAIASYSSGIAYFNVDLGSATTINNVKLTLYTQAANERPRDLAIDVLLEDGTWKRVAETHADDTQDIYGIYTSGTNYISDINTLNFNFEPVKCTAFRVTANAIGTKNMYGSSGNFRVNEIEAYNNPTITMYDYTGIEEPTVEGTEIPKYISNNLALGSTVTISASSYTQGNATRPVDGKTTTAQTTISFDSTTNCAYYNLEFAKANTINNVKLYFLPNAETTKRPYDFAVEVLTDIGWERVAERHNVATASVNSLSFKFAEKTVTAVRVTANKAGNSSCSNFMITEIEAYYDPTISESSYTGFEAVTVDGTEIKGIASSNVALESTVTVGAAGYATAFSSNATRPSDGNTENHVAILFDSTTNCGYYNLKLKEESIINNVKVHLLAAETDKRPYDFAVDVLTIDGWKRVAERHDFATASATSLIFNFAPEAARAVRVTANKAGNSSCANFMITEIAAYYNSGVTPNNYTGIEAATVTGTEIPLCATENVALESTVTVGVGYATAFATNATRPVDGTKDGSQVAISFDSTTNCAYYNLEFAKANTINNVKLYFLPNAENGKRPCDFAVDVLMDGVWKRVAERHNVATASVNSLTFNFAPETATAVRVTANKAGNSSCTNFMITEIEAYYDPTISESSYTGFEAVTVDGTEIPLYSYVSANLALGQKVTTSNTDPEFFGKYAVSKVTDGITSSDSVNDCAISNYDSNRLASFTVEFTETQTINNVKLHLSVHERDQRPYEYIVEVRTKDGWIRVATAKASNALTISINFAAVECDAFRVVANDKTRTAPNFRILEIAVYYNDGVNESNYSGVNSALVSDKIDEGADNPYTYLANVQGDVDGNTWVNAVDLTYSIKWYIRARKRYAGNGQIMDTNRDGKYDIRDIIKIEEILATRDLTII